MFRRHYCYTLDCGLTDCSVVITCFCYCLTCERMCGALYEVGGGGEGEEEDGETDIKMKWEKQRKDKENERGLRYNERERTGGVKGGENLAKKERQRRWSERTSLWLCLFHPVCQTLHWITYFTCWDLERGSSEVKRLGERVVKVENYKKQDVIYTHFTCQPKEKQNKS